MLAAGAGVRKDRDGEARGGSSAAAPSQAGGGGGDGRSSGTVSLGRAGSAAAAAPATTANARLRRELQSLATDPPIHCSLWPDENDMTVIHADMDGPENSPYAGGVFRLQVRVPDRYPFEPPQVQFRTKIYHPNIDAMGRICSDVLKMPPKGCWKPTLNIKTVFSALHILLSEPNPDDPLEQEIAVEYKSSHSIYCEKAAAHTRKHATGKQIRTGDADTERPAGDEKASAEGSSSPPAGPVQGEEPPASEGKRKAESLRSKPLLTLKKPRAR